MADDLAMYEKQLAEVEELLLQEPNEELQDLYDSLTEASGTWAGRAAGAASAQSAATAAAAHPAPAPPLDVPPASARCCRSSS